MAVAPLSDPVHRLLLVAVDHDFYRKAHHDLRYADVDPPRHYATAGWREGRDPAAWFSTSDYLALNPDVAAAGENPFVHYLLRGLREGRPIRASALADSYYAVAVGRGPKAVTPQERAAAAALFDERYYLATNPDVAASGADPLNHFLERGWREGRDPSADFSLVDYLQFNPDVAASGAHPFVHYAVSGKDEGRIGKVSLGFRTEALFKQRSFESRVAESAAVPVAEVSPMDRLADKLEQVGLSGLHLTFSHDDYSRSVGGLQLCLKMESAAFAGLGRNHLHIYPATPWPSARQGVMQTSMGVVLNGQDAGFYTPTAIAEALRRSAPAGPQSFAIHNMLGHSSRDVIDIVRSAGMNDGYFWVHDMGAVCAGVHLMRNDIESCGGPPMGSAACTICLYGEARAGHVREHQQLFDRLRLTVVAPSEAAMGLWLASSGLNPASRVVLPHASLEPAGQQAEGDAERPFRFAFPGSPSIHKGWPIFRALAARFADDPRYEFFHLATKPLAGAPAIHHPVTVTADDPLAMRRAMAELSIDAAAVWSLCFETFSFAAYEATAAGVAVVTGPDSGNVAAFAAEEGRGVVLADEKELEAWFESGRILQFARSARRPRLYDLAFSRFTAELAEVA